MSVNPKQAVICDLQLEILPGVNFSLVPTSSVALPIVFSLCPEYETSLHLDFLNGLLLSLLYTLKGRTFTCDPVSNFISSFLPLISTTIFQSFSCVKSFSIDSTKYCSYSQSESPFWLVPSKACTFYILHIFAK